MVESPITYEMTDALRSLPGLYHPEPRIDLLKIPFLGRMLTSRWGRLPVQVVLLGVALLVIYDGFTGPQLAPANSATVLAWVHYRGLVILGLLVAGNLFCFGCPFTLTRTLARNLSLRGVRWPQNLRNKWLSIAGILFILWLYEWLDLWASPWLTAWVVVAYFALSFLLEAVFRESAFCKYVCPLGAFNFVHSTVSPLQISARHQAVCATCVGKECVNGSAQVAGCGTELFVPRMHSNMDCTLCLDCARACPHDNVALVARSPLQESLRSEGTPRWDTALLLVTLAFFGISNAFGMVAPVYDLQSWLDGALGIKSEGLRVLAMLVIGSLVLPALVVVGASWITARVRPGERLVSIASRYAPAFVPVGFGIWLAHYGFHLAIGGLTIIPVLQSFTLDHGWAVLGTEPNWSLSYVLPVEWIFPLQVIAVLGGFFIALLVASRKSLASQPNPKQAFLALLPWAGALALVTAAALSIFNLPMDMRGTFLAG